MADRFGQGRFLDLIYSKIPIRVHELVILWENSHTLYEKLKAAQCGQDK